MELREVMRQAGACRAFSPTPVPDEVLHELFDDARFAPSGGNRQPVRFIVVRDLEVRRWLRDLYLTPWNAYLKKIEEGEMATKTDAGTVAQADHFARHLDEVPLLVVICARIPDLHITDRNLDRVSFVGGASVYPAVQNLLLACRDRGLGATLTTLVVEFEPEIKVMLGIPAEYAVAGTLAIGHPIGKLPTKLRRLPVEQIVFLERFGEAFQLDTGVRQ
jgi:nitroreductase